MNTVNQSLAKVVGTSQHRFSALRHGAEGFCLFLSQEMLTSYVCLGAAFCCINHHVNFTVMVISLWQAKELALSEGYGHVTLQT